MEIVLEDLSEDRAGIELAIVARQRKLGSIIGKHEQVARVFSADQDLDAADRRGAVPAHGMGSSTGRPRGTSGSANC
jgi:ribosomal protein L7Ae-like RNA K-turn-binding protein